MIELVSRSELAKRLRVSAQRVRGWVTDPGEDFPDPVARSGRTELWEWDAVARWAAGGRVPDTGEPRRPARSPEPSPPRSGIERVPVPADSFVGRDREMSELESMLRRHRLVTLAGSPGVGKTRLAVEFARATAHHWVDGVWFVPLAPVGDPGHIASVTAAALGVSQLAGRTPIESVEAHIGDRNLLVVLDNCEHLSEPAGQLVSRLLSACPNVRVLATSRSPLCADDESVQIVDALPIGPSGQPSAAERLFRDRAGAHLPVDEATAAAVTEICRHLDGLPLALEMAALWTKVLSAVEIAERLGDRFRLLARDKDALSHHDTLRGAVDWSHELLSEEERALFRRMAVFVGGCCLDGIEAVCSGPELAPEQVLETLASLVSRSLVVADTSRPPARFRFLETIGDYAGERLEEAGEVGALSLRHRQWCQALVGAAEPQFTGIDQAVWFDRVECELDNIRAVLRGLLDEGAGADALRLAAALTLFWRLRHRTAEGYEWLAQGLVTAGAAVVTGRAPDGTIGTLKYTLPAEKVPHGLSARVLLGLGLLGSLLGDANNGIAALGASAECARQTGDPLSEARAILFLGAVVASTNDHAAALVHLDRAADLAREAGDAWAWAHALAASGEVHLASGDPETASSLFDRCLAVARPSRDLEGICLGTVGGGTSRVELGDLKSARVMLTEGLDLSRRLGDPRVMCNALHSLGAVAMRQGLFDEAEDRWKSSLSLHRDLRWTPSEMGDLAALGELSLVRGNLDEADEWLATAFSLGTKGRQRLLKLEIIAAQLSLARGNGPAAQAMLDGVLTEINAAHGTRLLADLTHARALLARHQGDVRRASSLHYETLDLRHQAGDACGVVGSLESLGRLFGQLDRHGAAARLLGAADSLRQRHGYARYPVDEAGYTEDVARVRQSLGQQGFASGWAQGSGLSMDDAVSYASRGQGRRARDRPPTGWSSLTAAERNVMALVAEGLTNAQMAERLFVSVRTVESHLYGVYAKLGIKSRTELAKLCFERDPDGPGPDRRPSGNGYANNNGNGSATGD